MRRVLRQVRIAARGLAPVLLRGEGGVGKNHIAQAIHNDSTRSSRPFMASELLGEENEIRMTNSNNRKSIENAETSIEISASKAGPI